MTTLILDHEEVRSLLPMAECIEAMQQALSALDGDGAVHPLRTAMWLPQRTGLMGLMPGYLDRPEALGIKVVTVFPGNHGTPLESHQGVVLLFDPGDGRLLAVMDAGEITAIRTAAVSAVATRHLARSDAADLAILGCGTQARTHLEAMALVRPLRRVRVWSRNPQAARRFADRASVEAVATAQQAVDGADVICTVTAAREPVLHGAWLSPGCHVNAVGACFRQARELDTEAVRRSRLFVDRRESAMHEAGDVLLPIAEGAIDAGHVLAELGEVINGRAAGRTGPADVTLFKSLGLAAEDLAAARLIYDKAARGGVSRAVAIGGARHA